MLGKGDGSFKKKANLTEIGYLGTLFGATPMATADFNGDGNADLAVVNNKKNAVSVLLGRGDGTFALVREFATSAGTSSISTVDLNGDGATTCWSLEAQASPFCRVFGDGNFAAERNLVAVPTDVFAAA